MVVVNRYISLLAHHNLIPSVNLLKRRCLSCCSPFNSAKNAYDVLGVSEWSSFSEIKSSFRKLAKQTHPDLSPDDPDVSQQFVQILAAYEVCIIHFITFFREFLFLFTPSVSIYLSRTQLFFYFTFLNKNSIMLYVCVQLNCRYSG